MNCDWNSERMWGSGRDGKGYWGDVRVQSNAYILEKWVEEISTDFWQHGTTDRFREFIGFGG